MVKIKNLYFSYNGRPPFLLNDINLHIGKGDYVSILGDNGSGKSTLIKLIIGLLTPTKGSITCSFKKCGYLPQSFGSLNRHFPLTVIELLETYRRALKIKNKECVHELLNFVKMEQYKNFTIGTLSGGQLQKVLIARALLGQPELLVFDEPSSGIDMQSQQEIYDLIKSVNRDKKITVVTVEHNFKAAVENSSHLYHLKQGRGHLCRAKEYISELESKEEVK